MRRIAFVLGMLCISTGAAGAAEITPLVDPLVDPLVNVAWIKANGQRPEVVILDVRNKLGGGSEEAYREGHIPGAIYSDYLAAGWRGKVDGVPAQLPPVSDLEKLIGGLGIDNGKQVVVVAGGESALDMGSATRVYFTFKVLGHDAVAVLDGGYKAYAADPANPVESGWNAPQPATFTARFRPELLASKDQVAAALQSGTPLIDHRPPAQFRGETKHDAAARAGTIPGAHSVPEGELTTDGGTFVSAERFKELLKTAGVPTEGEEISFCNTGHWASLGWFLNSEVLGNKQARLYDGSMVDWTADQSLPVETKAGQ